MACERRFGARIIEAFLQNPCYSGYHPRRAFRSTHIGSNILEEEAQMGEVMSIAEIQVRFESEWILLEDPQTTESLEVRGGKVLWHSKDRDELYRKARELRPRHSAILYTGRLPENTAVVL